MIIKSIIFCDDIRQEVGNKLSAMGMFGDDLNFEVPTDAPAETPFPVSLALMLILERTDINNDLKDFDINISMTIGNNEFAKVAAKVEATGIGKYIHLPVPRFTFPVSNNTAFVINVQIMEKGTLVSESSATLNITMNRKKISTK